MPSSKVSGLGNGGSWYDNATVAERSYTPKAGDAAVKPGNPGHVAYVESVNPDGTITVSEYNHNQDGNGDTRTDTATSMGFTEFVDFGLSVSSDSSISTATVLPSLYLVQHYNSPSGMTEVKQLDPASSYAKWSNGYQTVDGWHSGSDVDYGMADYNQDGAADLYKIQHQNTPSGMTEVQIFDGAHGFQRFGGWVTLDGVHGGTDVHYIVADYNHDKVPDIMEIQHQYTASGMTEVRVMNGADNFRSWLTRSVTSEGWHNGGDVDFVAAACSDHLHPNVFEIQHQYTASGMTEVKEFDGDNNYTRTIAIWRSVDGWHSGNDVDYTAFGCGANSLPTIYVILHQNSPSGMTEVKQLNPANNYSSWSNGYVTADGWHSGNDVNYVMPPT